MLRIVFTLAAATSRLRDLTDAMMHAAAGWPMRVTIERRLATMFDEVDCAYSPDAADDARMVAAEAAS